MFHTDITFTLALIALVLAAHLVLSAKVHTDVSAVTCTFIGYVVVIVALLVLLFSGFSIVGKTLLGYQTHTQMMQIRHSQMMSEMLPMRLQKERMLRIHEAQMPMYDVTEHSKKPVKATTRKHK